MKFISFVIFCVFLFSSCTRKNEIEMFPPYKLINQFAEKIKPETGLVLRSYGINNSLPKDYERKGIGSFSARFSLSKMRNDEISLEYARNLIVSVAENFLEEINSNLEVRPDLDVYPFDSNRLKISVYFEDENRIELGQGVANVYFGEGKIKYESYKIQEYRSRYPSVGKHFVIHQESYAEAFDVVKKNGSLVKLHD